MVETILVTTVVGGLGCAAAIVVLSIGFLVLVTRANDAAARGQL